MTQIAKYPIDQAFVARLKANGFCLNDPDLRYPTRNDFPSRILKLAKQRGHGPAALLLGDRNGRGDPDRSRLVPWAALGLGSAGWPDDAAAHDHHAHLVWEESIPGFEPNLGFWQGLWADVMQSVQSVDLADPAWSLALLTGLLATQTIGVFQRLALLKASAARVVESQPDLFPETLNDADGDEYAVVANKPTSWRWCTDAASRQGQVRDENQDAFAVLGFGIALRAGHMGRQHGKLAGRHRRLADIFKQIVARRGRKLHETRKKIRVDPFGHRSHLPTNTPMIQLDPPSGNLSKWTCLFGGFHDESSGS